MISLMQQQPLAVKVIAVIAEARGGGQHRRGNTSWIGEPFIVSTVGYSIWIRIRPAIWQPLQHVMRKPGPNFRFDVHRIAPPI